MSEQALSVYEQHPVSRGIFLDMDKFTNAQRVGQLLASSSLVPEHFRGNVANCVIALNLADRLMVDPFMMMQNMYVVHGRPGIEGKLAIALVEGTGRFSPLKYKFTGKGKTDSGVDRPDVCIAYATELKTGETVEGPPVSWEMAKAEGWLKPKKDMISKWHTMPDLMFRYRAAMFFARVNCPGALLGLRTLEEIDDIEMVPGGIRGEFVAPDTQGEQPTETPAFDSTIPEGTDMAVLDDFIARTATAQRITADEVKAAAAKEPEGFWKAFGAWCRQEAKKKALQAETEHAPRPCPNKEDVTYTKAHCDACPQRPGCPAWES